MARRTFDMVDLVEIYTHWDAGRSRAQIARSLGLSPKTVRKYLAPLVAAEMRPGGACPGRGGMAGAGRTVVPGTGRCPAAAGELAEVRGPPRLHRRAGLMLLR